MDDYQGWKADQLGAGHLNREGYWGTLSLEELERRKMEREAGYARYRTQAEDAQDKLIKDI
mgnify:CR=1 FL=1